MHVLFDLDGTLTDSSPGIVRCVNYALVQLGRDPAPPERLRRAIGTPLAAIFSELLDTEDEATLDRAVAAYRVRFHATGMFENALYPGVADALATLCRAGHRLQIVTAKPADTARSVVAHFGIAACFHAVHGPHLTARGCDKTALVAAALDTAGADGREAVMVGDRAADMMAARHHGVFAIAAGWGYGTRDELRHAGADYFAEQVADVVRWVDRRIGSQGAGSP